jgi:membrane fusion protein (multidrug efflux system)
MSISVCVLKRSQHRVSALVLTSISLALSLSACGAKEVTAVDQKQSASSPVLAPKSTSTTTAASESTSEKRAAVDKSGSGASPNGRSGKGPPPPNVVVAAVREVPFTVELEALGTAKANEAVDITAKVSNRVTAIRFREGQYVRSGDVLVELDAEETRADLAIAEAALGDSRSQVNRSRELFQTKSLSAQQMEQLESTLRANEARVASAKSRLNEQFIRAPFAGRVGLRNVSIGSLVNTGTVITTLDDISVMKLDFSVPETYLSMLSEGLAIEARSAAYPGQNFSGRVLSVGSRIDPVSRSIVVRAQLPNRDAKLKPGMFMTVRLSSPASRSLVVPEQALVPERDKQFVFLLRDGKTVKTEIVTGRRRPGEVEVLAGLRAGEMVVTEGTQKVRDGGAVKVDGRAE